MVSLIATVTNIVLNYLFIPRYGIEGAAAATSISLFLQGVLLVILCFQSFKVHFVNSDFLKVSCAALFPALGIYFAQKELLSSPLMSATLVGVFLALYCIALIVVRAYDAKDIAVLSSLVRRRVS